MAYLSLNPFLGIIAGTTPSDILYQDDDVIAFRDINPQASTHILVCPTAEIVSALDVNETNVGVFGKLFLVAKQVAKNEGLTGYKLHMNVGEDGGQIVPHVHLHLLSADYRSPL